jgi:hypothetical protein
MAFRKNYETSQMPGNLSARHRYARRDPGWRRSGRLRRSSFIPVESALAALIRLTLHLPERASRLGPTALAPTYSRRAAEPA